MQTSTNPHGTSRKHTSDDSDGGSNGEHQTVEQILVVQMLSASDKEAFTGAD